MSETTIPLSIIIGIGTQLNLNSVAGERQQRTYGARRVQLTPGSRCLRTGSG